MIILTIILFIFLILVCLLIAINIGEEDAWLMTSVIIITTILIAIYSIFIADDIVDNNNLEILQQIESFIFIGD